MAKKFTSIDDNYTLNDLAHDGLEPFNDFCAEILREFRACVFHRRSLRVGDYSLSALLHECYNARDDKTLEEEMRLRERYPQWSCMPISIVSFKVGILVAMIRESLLDVSRAPFIVDPTPSPEIPESARNAIIDSIIKDLTGMAEGVLAEQGEFLQGVADAGAELNLAPESDDYPSLAKKVPELLELFKRYKVELRKRAKDYAREQALLLQNELYDKVVEGGWRKSLLAFIDDFCTYPFAVMHAPVPTSTRVASWNGDKFEEQDKVIWGFERVSPFDFFWTADSTDTQDGSGIFIRKRVGVDYLYKCRKLAKGSASSGYLLGAIDALMERVESGSVPRNWVTFMLDNPEVKENDFLWSRGDTVELLIRYGRNTGRELLDLGVVSYTKGSKTVSIDEDMVYESKVVVCGGQVILCQVNNNPSQYKRPVFTASFESRNGSIVGVGLGQKLLSLHKAYRAVIALAMYNLGLSSEPITELEVDRIAEYLPDEWLDNAVVSPGMVISASSDRVGNGSRAVKFTQIPNTTASALQLASHIFDLSHVVSNIPAALHGQPVGSGANRTVRGLLTLQGNVLKPIQSALINLDTSVIEPMVTLLYMLLVMYEDGFDYTGDCKIVAKGASSMVEREIDKQTAMENLQILGQLGQGVDSELINRTVGKLLVSAGVIEPDEEFSVAKQEPSPAPVASVSSQVAGEVDPVVEVAQ